MSRYMNRIIEINPEEGCVRVEAGVIKDQLNQALKPYGYFLRRNFPPVIAPRLAV
ncbi:FAD-binding protein [Salmonella sp. WGH-01]|nr:FAD-binding protein [Salmonella sp. WGH-01]